MRKPSYKSIYTKYWNVGYDEKWVLCVSLFFSGFLFSGYAFCRVLVLFECHILVFQIGKKNFKMPWHDQKHCQSIENFITLSACSGLKTEAWFELGL